MRIPVIDACVAIKFFLPEEGFEKAGTLMNRYNRMISPDLFMVEFDAIIEKKVRQKLLDSDGAYELFNEIRKLPIEIISYSEISRLAIDLSVTLPISLCDACYLAVAIEFDQQVITADNRFYRGIRGTPFESNVIRL